MRALHLKQIVLAAVAAAGLSVAGGAQAGYIDPVTNLEWRQLTETLNISYNSLNTGGVNGCSAATGACSGSLGAVDLNGWTWATEPEVRTLFHNFSGAQFIPGFTPQPVNAAGFFQVNSTWAPAIIDRDGAGADQGIFDGTFQSAFFDTAVGITRTVHASGGSVFLGQIIDRTQVDEPDLASTNTTQPLPTSHQGIGVWLYRQAPTSEVPVTPASMLLAIGIAALWSVRRLTARVA